RGSGSVEDRLEDVLRKLCANRDYTASSFVDDSKKTQTITIQTPQIRFCEAFPGVVMLDSARGTNSSKYKLFSVMIDDVLGHVSAHCLNICLMARLRLVGELGESLGTRSLQALY
ncbi:hypothetical protein JG687_00019053, partial [Phytophthora cactorum]